MAFTYGFYNSLNGDRKYNSEQMAAVFDCLINDGVQMNIGDKMMVKTSSEKLTVSVGSGRAWFNSTWSYNDTDYPFSLSAVTASGYSRIDAICLVVDKNVAIRKTSLVVVSGTAAASPAKPTIPVSANRYYHILGYVTVKYGDTTIPAAQIENRVGTSDCPFITGILETVTADELLTQWRGEFDIWWEGVKSILNENVAANLQNQIDHISIKEATMNLFGLSNIPTNTSSTKKYAEYSTDAVANKLAITTTTGNLFGVNTKSNAAPLDAILNQISILFNKTGKIINYINGETKKDFTESGQETIDFDFIPKIGLYAISTYWVGSRQNSAVSYPFYSYILTYCNNDIYLDFSRRLYNSTEDGINFTIGPPKIIEPVDDTLVSFSASPMSRGFYVTLNKKNFVQKFETSYFYIASVTTNYVIMEFN